MIKLVYRRRDGGWGHACGAAVTLHDGGQLRLEHDGVVFSGSSLLTKWERKSADAQLSEIACPEPAAGQRNLRLHPSETDGGPLEVWSGERLLVSAANGLALRFNPLGIDLADAGSLRPLGPRFSGRQHDQPLGLLWRDEVLAEPLIISTPDYFDGATRLAAIAVRPGVRGRVSALAERQLIPAA